MTETIKFHTIFDNALDAMAVIKDKKFVTVNPAYMALFGYDTPEQLIGTAITEKFTNFKDESDFTATARRQDNSEFDAQVRVINTDDGQSIVIVRPTQPQDDELRRALLEIWQPLINVKAALDLIGLSDLIPDEFQTTYTSMDVSVGKMVNIIQDTLHLYRPSQERKEIELVSFCRKIVEQFKLDNPEEIFDFTSNIQDTPIMANKRHLHRAISEMLKNAIKFSPKSPRITITLDKSDTHVTIAIRDGGVGISKETIARLLSDDDSLIKKQESGEGLGLAIAKKMIEKHDGRIEVESTVGEGSTFKIILPLTND